MAFWGFVRKHLWPSLIGGAGTLIAVWGFLGNAQSLWTAGVKPAYLQLSGFVLFLVGVVSVLYRQQQHLEERLGSNVTKSGPVFGPLGIGVTTPERLHPDEASQEMPDARLPVVVEYMQRSIWTENHNADIAAILQELKDKLSMGQIVGFGRPVPNASIIPILRNQWPALTILLDGDKGVAVIGDNIAFHDIQLDMMRVRDLWPQPQAWLGV